MKYLTDYVQHGGIVETLDGYVAVEENGELKLQKLSFNGIEATPDGATEVMLEVGLFPTGMEEPAYAGSGGSGETKFYQCAGVDTSTKTWSGYELILENGYYTLSTTLTSGLTYTVFTTPVVGTVYSEDALVKVASYAQNMPSDGLVLHYNMNDVGDTVTDTVNNIILTSNGTEIFSGATGVDGTCWGTSGGTTSYLAGTYPNALPSVFSMNLYIKYNGASADTNVAIVEFGNNSDGTGYGLWVNTSGQLSWRINGNYNHYTSTNLTLPVLKFVMITFTYDGENVCIYQNGILHKTESCTDIPSTSSSFGFFSRLAGGDRYGTNGSFVGVVDEFRFYNRALTQEEITLLASYLTPEDEPTPEVPPEDEPEDEPVPEIPTEGLVLYSSFNINSDNFTMDYTDGTGTCETGQSVSRDFYIDPEIYPDTNTPFFTKDGIPCFYSNYDIWGRGLSIDDTGVPMNGEAVSFSIWYKDEGSQSSTAPLLFSIGHIGHAGLEPSIYTSGNKFYMMYSSYNFVEYTLPDDFDVKKWHHYVITYATDGTTKIYLDGTLWQTYNTVMKIESNSIISIGYSPGNGGGNCGWISSLRIYNYVLTDDDVRALKSEFTPTE